MTWKDDEQKANEVWRLLRANFRREPTPSQVELIMEDLERHDHTDVTRGLRELFRDWNGVSDPRPKDVLEAVRRQQRQRHMRAEPKMQKRRQTGENNLKPSEISDLIEKQRKRGFLQ